MCLPSQGQVGQLGNGRIEANNFTQTYDQQILGCDRLARMKLPRPVFFVMKDLQNRQALFEDVRRGE